MLGPGSYSLPDPGWRRHVRGSVSMARMASDRASRLADGRRIADVLRDSPPPSPPATTKRAISPTLLQVVQRRRRPPLPSPRRNTSPVRESSLPSVGPGAYDVSPPRGGPYSHGIVFSSVSRGLDPVPRSPPPTEADLSYLSPSSFNSTINSSARSPRRGAGSDDLMRPSTASIANTTLGTFGRSPRLLGNSLSVSPFVRSRPCAPPPGTYNLPSPPPKSGAVSVSIGRYRRDTDPSRRTPAPPVGTYDLTSTDIAPPLRF